MIKINQLFQIKIFDLLKKDIINLENKYKFLKSKIHQQNQ